MEPVIGELSQITQPTLERLLRSDFDMKETELDLYLCVMGGGEPTVSELDELAGDGRMWCLCISAISTTSACCPDVAGYSNVAVTSPSTPRTMPRPSEAASWARSSVG